MHSIILALATLVAIGAASTPYSCPVVLVKAPGVRCGNLGHATNGSRHDVLESLGATDLERCGEACLALPACRTMIHGSSSCDLLRYNGDTLGWSYHPAEYLRLYNRACFVKPDPCFYLQVDSPGAPVDNRTITLGRHPRNLHYPTGFDGFAASHDRLVYFTIADGLLYSIDSIREMSLLTYTPADSMLNYVEFVPTNETQGLTTATCSVDPILNVLNFQDPQGNPLQSQSCAHRVNGKKHNNWFLTSPGVMDPTFCEAEHIIQLAVVNGTRG